MRARNWRIELIDFYDFYEFYTVKNYIRQSRINWRLKTARKYCNKTVVSRETRWGIREQLLKYKRRWKSHVFRVTESTKKCPPVGEISCVVWSRSRVVHRFEMQQHGIRCGFSSSFVKDIIPKRTKTTRA